MELDFTGKVVAGRGLVEDTALFIHLAVHRQLPQARCVFHTHMPYATALGALADPTLAMATQSALGFYDDIAYVDYNGLAFDGSEGERLARALGARSVLMMRNHGVLVVGSCAAEAFERLYFLERACQSQILALSSGRALYVPPPEVVRATAAQFKSGDKVGGESRSELHFLALKRLLDRQEADYAS
jgi:ribulose-5-phosphate 4-epimerase/fuculose-1-phosphate aldolase